MDLELRISQYIDGELSGEEEAELHHMLAVSPEARTLFREHLTLQTIAHDERILHRPTQDMREGLFARLQAEEGMKSSAAVGASVGVATGIASSNIPSVARRVAPDRPSITPKNDQRSEERRRRRRLIPILIPLMLCIIVGGIWYGGGFGGNGIDSYADAGIGINAKQQPEPSGRNYSDRDYTESTERAKIPQTNQPTEASSAPHSVPSSSPEHYAALQPSETRSFAPRGNASELRKPIAVDPDDEVLAYGSLSAEESHNVLGISSANGPMTNDEDVKLEPSGYSAANDLSAEEDASITPTLAYNDGAVDDVTKVLNNTTMTFDGTNYAQSASIGGNGLIAANDNIRLIQPDSLAWGIAFGSTEGIGINEGLAVKFTQTTDQASALNTSVAMEVGTDNSANYSAIGGRSNNVVMGSSIIVGGANNTIIGGGERYSSETTASINDDRMRTDNLLAPPEYQSPSVFSGTLIDSATGQSRIATIADKDLIQQMLRNNGFNFDADSSMMIALNSSSGKADDWATTSRIEETGNRFSNRFKGLDNTGTLYQGHSSIEENVENQADLAFVTENKRKDSAPYMLDSVKSISSSTIGGGSFNQRGDKAVAVIEGGQSNERGERTAAVSDSSGYAIESESKTQNFKELPLDATAPRRIDFFVGLDQAVGATVSSVPTSLPFAPAPVTTVADNSSVASETRLSFGAEFDEGRQRLFATIGSWSYDEKEVFRTRTTTQQVQQVVDHVPVVDASGTTSIVDVMRDQVTNTTQITVRDEERASREIWGGIGYRYSLKVSAKIDVGPEVWGGVGSNYLHAGLAIPLSYKLDGNLRVELIPRISYHGLHNTAETVVTGALDPATTNSRSEEHLITPGDDHHLRASAGIGLILLLR